MSKRRKQNLMNRRVLTAVLSTSLIFSAVTPVFAEAENTAISAEKSNDVEPIPSSVEENSFEFISEDSSESGNSFPEESTETDSESFSEDISENQDLTVGPSDDSIVPFDSGESIENLDYILGRPMTDEEIAKQLEPFESLETPQESVSVGTASSEISLAALEASYDSRDYGWVSPVKNQLDYGMCWSFALVSNIETSLLMQGLGNYDLSEEHLAYFLYNRTDDPLGNTADDHIITSGNYHNAGGNDIMASAFLSTWSGLALESLVSLPTDSCTDHGHTNVYSQNLAYQTSAYLKNAVFSDYSIDVLKSLVKEYGSVSVSYMMDSNYYNASTGAYCYPRSYRYTNHAVNVVGWDDTYSKNNFKSASGVTSDGAWIVKNSWGSGWGDSGYCYISYQDPTISTLVCNTAVTAAAYPNNYFYDGAGTGSSSLDFIHKNEGAANIFTASAGNSDEELGEVVLEGELYDSFADLKIQVYTDLTNTANPLSGTLAYTDTCHITASGIYTVPLKQPVQVKKGTSFSVVLTLLDGTFSYFMESAYDSGWIQTKVKNSANQSFYVYRDGSCNDVSEYNDGGWCFSIKAHTRNTDSTAEPTPTAAPTSTPKPTASPTPKADPTPTNTPSPIVTPTSAVTPAPTTAAVAGKLSVTLKSSSVTYNGKAQKVSVKSVSYKGKKLSSGNYTVSYKDNKNPGIATVIITGKGTYRRCTGTVTFKILPKKNSISSLKAGSKKATVKWSKANSVTGYQISYSYHKNFKNAVTKNAGNKTSWTIKGLKSRKKLYVRVRSYKKSGSTYLYSSWSSPKNITVK